MGYVLGLPLITLLAILQSTVLGTFRLLDGAPDLVLLAVVGWAQTGRAREALVFALWGGLSLDLLSGAPFGMTAIGLIVIAFLVSLLEGRFWEANFLLPLGVMVGATVIYHAGLFLAAAATGRPVDLDQAVTRVFLPSAVLDILLALPTAQLAWRIHETLFPPRVRVG